MCDTSKRPEDKQQTAKRDIYHNAEEIDHQKGRPIIFRLGVALEKRWTSAPGVNVVTIVIYISLFVVFQLALQQLAFCHPARRHGKIMMEMMREALQTATNLYDKFEKDYLTGVSSEDATAKWEASADQIAQIDKDLFSRDWRIKSSHRPGDSSLMPLDVPPKLYAVPPAFRAGGKVNIKTMDSRKHGRV